MEYHAIAGQNNQYIPRRIDRYSDPTLVLMYIRATFTRLTGSKTFTLRHTKHGIVKLRSEFPTANFY
jgi:hypothetical protein